MSPKHGRKVKLAYQDPNFMDSIGARPVRIISEYLDPKYRLRRGRCGRHDCHVWLRANFAEGSRHHAPEGREKNCRSV